MNLPSSRSLQLQSNISITVYGMQQHWADTRSIERISCFMLFSYGAVCSLLTTVSDSLLAVAYPFLTQNNIPLVQTLISNRGAHCERYL